MFYTLHQRPIIFVSAQELFLEDTSVYRTRNEHFYFIFFACNFKLIKNHKTYTNTKEKSKIKITKTNVESDN